MNPDEVLWITLTWQNRGSAPAPERYRFYLDVEFGSQRKTETKNYDSRIYAGAMPETTLWENWGVYKVTFRWENRTGWAGTFLFHAGITGKTYETIRFIADGKPVGRCFAGETDCGWNFGRPWVFENAKPTIISITARNDGVIMERGDGDVITRDGGIVIASNDVAETARENVLADVYVAASDMDAACSFITAGDMGVASDTGVTGDSESTCGFYAHISTDSPRILAFCGADASYKLENATASAEIYNPETQTYYYERDAGVSVKYKWKSPVSGTVEFSCRAAIDGVPAAEYEIFFNVIGRVLTIGARLVANLGGYILLGIKFPALAEMKTGYLLDFYGSGRLTPVQTPHPAWYEKKYDVRNAAVLYDDKAMFIVESGHIDSRITTGIYHANGENRVFAGGTIVMAIPGRGAPCIPVAEPPVFTVEMPETMVPPDWNAAAELLRRGVEPNGARGLYRNTYFYKQLATWGPVPDIKYRDDECLTTRNQYKTVAFDDIARNARGFHNLTDGAKQVVYVAGFQKGGFDTAYPAPFEAEPRCGGDAGLIKCLDDIRAFGGLAGLHDNFDDICADRVADIKYTALDARGEKSRGWIWAGGMTYQTGWRKYIESTEPEERIKRMVKTFGLKDTYHIDVLTAETCRYDFDPAHLSSAEDSFRAKMEIVGLFNKHGIDVTSEMLTHPAVGKIGFALHTRFDPDEVYIDGGAFVPLVQMIYHGTVGYCAPGRTDDEILWGLLLGGQTFYEEDITGDLCVSRFYIQNIPAMRLYDKKMINFTFNGKTARATYENDSYVEADFNAKKYVVVCDGAEIGKDFTTFVTGNTPGCHLFYSMTGNHVSYDLPASLSSGSLICTVLTADGAGGRIEGAERVGDQIIYNFPPMTPVKITRA